MTRAYPALAPAHDGRSAGRPGCREYDLHGSTGDTCPAQTLDAPRGFRGFQSGRPLGDRRCGRSNYKAWWDESISFRQHVPKRFNSDLVAPRTHARCRIQVENIKLVPSHGKRLRRTGTLGATGTAIPNPSGVAGRQAVRLPDCETAGSSRAHLGPCRLLAPGQSSVGASPCRPGG